MRLSPAVLACIALATPVLAQSPSRDWRPADRTVIGDFTYITSIACALDRVYITSPAAVLLWHPQFQQWEGPYDPPDPALLSRVFGSLVDPLDNSLWLARPDGWVHYQPELQLWDSGTVPDGVITLAFDKNDPVSGLYLRTRRGWVVVPRGGLTATAGRAPVNPVTPVSVDEVLRSSPTLQANAAQILLDPHLRSVRYTAAARSFDNQGWFLGTSGVGTLYLMDGAAIPERLTFGLPSPVVGAVLAAPDGIWAATQRTQQADAALTLVDPELKSFRSLRGLPATGVPFTQVRELAGQGTRVWAATDFGVARIETRDGRIDLVDVGRGLPDARVYAVVSRQGRITVGTARGIARVSDSLTVERLAPAFSEVAYAVFPIGDSVWVGTSRGLLMALPGERDLLRPSTLASASQRAPVVALSSLGDTLVGLTRDQMLWRDPRTSAWTLGPNLSAVLGGLRNFTPDGAGFWVVGERGVAFARLSTPPMRPLRAGDLPGAAYDVAVDDKFLWVATDVGLVRFRLDAVRP
jgi:ligand-binding sensor domain-containing protein